MNEVFEDMIEEFVREIVKNGISILETFGEEIAKLQYASESVNEAIICASMNCRKCPYRDDKYERWTCIFTLDAFMNFVIDRKAGVYRLYPRGGRYE